MDKMAKKQRIKRWRRRIRRTKVVYYVICIPELLRKRPLHQNCLFQKI